MKTRRFPGKLYLMGEYFVTQDFNDAIIIAVDRFIETETEISKIFHLKSEYGEIIENEITTDEMRIALEAVKISYEYLNFISIEKQALNINIKSDLLEDGIKVGLGSSAVIIVAIIQSILESHHIYLDKLKLFKISVLCQKRLRDLSSGGDLAASIFTGIVYYKKYNKNILSEKESFELLDTPWAGLEIKNLKYKNDFKIMVGWTKKANKTDNYLKVFNQMIIQDPKSYAEFTKRAQDYVKMFMEGKLQEAISNYRQLMLELETWTYLDIETVELKQAIELALEEEAYAKVSGSGGGDCMVAINVKNEEKLINAWTKNNIKYLNIGVWKNEPITKKR